MINLRLILFLLGYFVTFTGVLMLIPCIVDALSGYTSTAVLFFIFSILTLFVGSILILSNRQEQYTSLGIKEGLLLTFINWVVIVSIAALPFHFSYLKLSYTDSFFELMSAVTTTGASVIPKLGELTYGFHIWRAIWQWIGGIGIIIVGVILIPLMQGGGMNIFKAESFETFDNAFDKAKRIAKGMFVIYVFFTLAIILALIFIAKLDLLDSIVHALTSVSTAGFSTQDGSIMAYNNPNMEVILSVAMLVGGIPYTLLYYFIFLRKKYLLIDEQVRGYLFAILVSCLIMVLWLHFHNNIEFYESMRYSTFMVISLMTGTGFISVDYEIFGNFPTMFLFTLMFIGGCAGSTACGIKIYRFQIAKKILSMFFKNVLFKNIVNIPSYNGRALSKNEILQVFVFLYLFIVILFTVSIILSAMGLDFITAFSAAASCLTNVGPGLGDLIGASTAGNFALLPDSSKWLLSFVMLIGRLEIIGVLIIFSKYFWNNF